MTANTLNMHYTIACPENFGITNYPPVLPNYNSDKSNAIAELNTTLQTLSKIRQKNLDSQDAYLYSLLTKKLNNTVELHSYPYYEEPLSPNSGVQSQLPILLAEYTFRTKQDVEDYLALLDQVDTYFASLLAYEQEKATAGLSQSTQSLKSVKSQCDTIVAKEEVEQGNHFLQTSFKERLCLLLSNHIITSDEAKKYLATNDRLLKTVVQPAYEALADGLFLLEDLDGVPAKPYGLSALPEGQKYYEALLIAQTGSYRPISDIKTLVADRVTDEHVAMKDLLAKYPELAASFSQGTYAQLSCTDATTMLADLQERMNKDFPSLYPYAPTAAVKNVSQNLQEYCAPAYYLTSPLDSPDTNVIYINQKNAPTGMELYTTLAHEGFPGHLYQTVYHHHRAYDLGENEARCLLWYGGYLEGWALYVEFYSYDYLIEQLNEEARDTDALCVELEKHNRDLLLGIYATLDIMIHYDNASRNEVCRYLSQFGINNEAAANAVYDYIAQEPCNYLKYYLGYLEILNLKEQAKVLWGENYTDYAFHRFILDAGPSDFDSLQGLLH